MKSSHFPLMAVALVGGAFPAAAQGDDQRADSGRAALRAHGLPAVPPPPAGMGQVVFFRSAGLWNRAPMCRVRERKQVVNSLPRSTYFIQVITPGAHEYSVYSEEADRRAMDAYYRAAAPLDETYSPVIPESAMQSVETDRLRIQVGAGETHYVRCTIRAGAVVGLPNLSPQSREEFSRRGRGLAPQPPYLPDEN